MKCLFITPLAAAALLVAAAALAQQASTASPAPAADVDAPAAAAPPAVAPPRLDLRQVAPIRGDAAAGKAKSEVCAACHGANGIAAAPIFPNLAGQHADYLYWELVGYKRGMLPDSPMAPLAATLSDQDMRDLATYFASQPAMAAAPAEDGQSADAGLLATGERLFLQGDPAKGIPPCQGCHGADGRGYPLAGQPAGGTTAWTLYPAIKGQQQAYLQSRLTAFKQGQLHDSTTDMVMTGVARQLDDDTITALSTWLAAPAK